jgi:hypothetical protein
MLVLHTVGIYDGHSWDGSKGHDIPTFKKTGRDVKGMLWFCLSNQKGFNVDITDVRDL